MQVYELYVCALSMGNVYSLHINHTSALGSHPPLHHQQALTLHAKFVTFQKPQSIEVFLLHVPPIGWAYHGTNKLTQYNLLDFELEAVKVQHSAPNPYMCQLQLQKLCITNEFLKYLKSPSIFMILRPSVVYFIFRHPKLINLIITKNVPKQNHFSWSIQGLSLKMVDNLGGQQLINRH